MGGSTALYRLGRPRGGRFLEQETYQSAGQYGSAIPRTIYATGLAVAVAELTGRPMGLI